MADDKDDWFSSADEPAADVSAVGGGGGAAAEVIHKLDEGLGKDDPPASKKRTKWDTDMPVICKVWKRPVFRQYSYLFDYRHNYYDDVIDYLDRRQRGISRDIPRPQTWAERALRTYCTKVRSSEAYRSREKDISLLSDIRTSERFYNYHSKEYLSNKYSNYL